LFTASAPAAPATDEAKKDKTRTTAITAADFSLRFMIAPKAAPKHNRRPRTAA
jgi:hypothetical protein